MLLHNLYYTFKTTIKNKSLIIWTLIFPIGLATFMYMAFGNLYETEEIFHAIPVAMVVEEENQALQGTLSVLSASGEDQLLDLDIMSETDALKALEDEEIVGIIYVNTVPRLVVEESSYKATVIQTILDEYMKMQSVINDIAEKNPENLQGAVEAMMSESEVYTEISTSEGNQNIYTNYFYAIFAMSCLFGSFATVEKVSKLQANISTLGMRRGVSPCSKGISILSEFLSSMTVQFVVEIITLIYLEILGVELGDRYLAILGILLLGSAIGVALGAIVGSIPKGGEGLKVGLAVSISMALSVMADLVAAGVKDIIEHKAPIINRINPAALITDSFYALNVYEGYERYARNMLTLLVMTVLLLGISFMILRRNKYASL